jgi:hypothetical protein
MRRLLRWTFHALAAMSLLLSLATAGLWVRSYWVYDDCSAINTRRHGYECVIRSHRGQVAGWYYANDERPIPRSEFQLDQLPQRVP